MFFGVTVGLFRLVWSFLWLMCMLPAMMGLNKGCGLRFLRDYNLWVGAGFVSAVTLMLLNMLMNGGLPGWDLGLWTIFLLVSLSRIITWWIFPCTGASLLGSKGMVSR
jgi:hypothetical protein